MNYHRNIVRILTPRIHNLMSNVSTKRQLSIRSMSDAITKAELCLGYSTKDLCIKQMALNEKMQSLMNDKLLVRHNSEHPVLTAERKLDPEIEVNYKSRALLTLLLAKVVSSELQALNETVPQFKFNLNSPEPTGSPTGSSLTKQLLLAETIELIYGGCVYHTLGISPHRQVGADTPQHSSSNSVDSLLKGNRMAVLKGNLLFSMATKNLVKLGNSRVTEWMSRALRDFVEGEYLCLKLRELVDTGNDWSHVLENWVNACTLRSGSLLAQGCKSMCHVTSGGTAEQLEDRVYRFGNSVAFAWAVAEELDQFNRRLDNRRSDGTIDTAVYSLPILLHMSSHPELIQEMDSSDNRRQFIDNIIKDLTSGCDAIKKTESLIDHYSDTAVQQIKSFKDSEAKEALVNVVLALKQS